MSARNVALLVAVLAALSASAKAQDSYGAFADRDSLLTMPITPTVILVCHGFNCLFRDEVSLSSRDLSEIVKLMRPGKASAAAERAAIAKTMAFLDRRIGPEIGTAGHVAAAGPSYSGNRGQFDCIDATHNSTLMLRELLRLQLLVHHHIVEPASRLGPPLHSAAVIVDNRSGEPWAVDSWTRAYGEPPDIMPLRLWLAGALPEDQPQPAPRAAAKRAPPAPAKLAPPARP